MRCFCAILLLPLALVGQTAGDDAASISGVVTNAASGEPIRRTLVYLRRIDISPGTMNVQVSKTTYTDVAGRFAIDGIKPGRYQLSAERTGFITASYGQRSPTGSGTLISLEAGQKLSDAAMRMTPHGVIAGRVVDEDGEPVIWANVQALRQQYVQGKKQFSQSATGTTNDLGEYRLFGLRPGRYYISAINRPNPMLPQTDEEYVPTYFPHTADVAVAVPLDVTPGIQLRNVDVGMRKMRAVTVSGRVSSEIPTPSGADGSQRMSVMLAPRAGGMGPVNTRGGTVTPQGTFEIRSVTPGSYWLTAVVMGGGKTITTRTPVQVGSSPVEGISLVVRPGVPVVGKVKVDGDLPANLERVRVSLAPDEVSGVQFAPVPGSQLKADGSFQFEEVGADRYTVAVTSLPEGFFVKAIRAANLDVLSSGIEIAGQSPAPLEVVVSPNAGEVSGTVMNKDQKPALEATVVLVPQEKWRRERQHYYRTAASSLTGQYTFKDVIPGEYRVYAWEDVEFGAWMDPAFLKPLESRGEAASVGEGARLTLQVNLISTDAQ